MEQEKLARSLTASCGGGTTTERSRPEGTCFVPGIILIGVPLGKGLAKIFLLRRMVNLH